MRLPNFSWHILVPSLSSPWRPPLLRRHRQSRNERIVIAASHVLDGKGLVQQNQRIVVEGSKIVAVEPLNGGPVDYDLRGLTVLPGWIDAHVHITWIFGKDGKNAGTDGTTQDDAYQRGVECLGNADGRLHYGAERRRSE